MSLELYVRPYMMACLQGNFRSNIDVVLLILAGIYLCFTLSSQILYNQAEMTRDQPSAQKALWMLEAVIR